MVTKFSPTLASSHLVGTPKEEAPLTPEMEDVDVELAKEFNKKIDVLRAYLVLAENPADLSDENQRRVIFSKLSYGFRKSGEYLSWARFQLRSTSIDAKRAESVAMLDGVHEFIVEEKDKGRDGKVTDKVRESYKNLDKDYTKALTKQAMAEAMVEQLQTMKWEFSMAISTIKAMAYGSSDQDYISSSASSGSE